MGKFILDLVDRNNAFILTLMDKCISILNMVSTGGRKMTVTIVTMICFTILGTETILTLQKLPNTLIYVAGACVMAFFGFNVWAYFSPKVNGPDPDSMKSIDETKKDGE